MTQVKKKFLFALLIIIFFGLLFPIKVNAEEIQSDIVDQKSVIDEQKDWPNSIGAGLILDLSFLKEMKSVVTKKKEIKEVSPYFNTINSLTEAEKELICRITWLEAGNQCEEGQRAVIEVILNRFLSEEWPNDITEILSSPSQFSTWKNRNKVTDEQVNLMKDILNLVYSETEVILPSFDYVYFDCADHKKKNQIKIQGHWFWI